MEKIKDVDKAANFLELLHYGFGVLLALNYFWGTMSDIEPNASWVYLLGLWAVVLMICAGVCTAKRKYMLAYIFDFISGVLLGPLCWLLAALQ